MEIMSDVFMSWLPFYFEIKVIVLIWLLGGRGSSAIYRNVIHPTLVRREQVGFY
jgi:receptor expression-enhancing protein 1/2/3/4